MKYICEVVPMAFLVLHYQFPPGKPTEMPSHHRAHETHAGALLIPLGRGPRALNVARFLIFTADSNTLPWARCILRMISGVSDNGEGLAASV